MKKMDLLTFSQQPIQSDPVADKVKEEKTALLPKQETEVIKLRGLNAPPQWGLAAIFDHFDQEGKKIVSVTWPRGEPNPIVLWEWK